MHAEAQDRCDLFVAHLVNRSQYETPLLLSGQPLHSVPRPFELLAVYGLGNSILPGVRRLG